MIFFFHRSEKGSQLQASMFADGLITCDMIDLDFFGTKFTW